MTTTTRPDATAWSKWIRFWFAPADPTVLGFIRVITGLLVLYNGIVYSFDLTNFFGEKAFISVETINRERQETPTFVTPLNSWQDQPKVLQLPDPPHRRKPVLAYVRELAADPIGIRRARLAFPKRLLELDRPPGSDSQPYAGPDRYDHVLTGLEFVKSYLPADDTVRKNRLAAIVNEGLRGSLDTTTIPNFIKRMPQSGPDSREQIAEEIEAFLAGLPKDKDNREYIFDYLMETGLGRGDFIDFLLTLPEDQKARDEQVDYLAYWNVDKRKVFSMGKVIFSPWFYITDPTEMAVLHSAIIGLIVLFTVGLFTRVTSVLTWIATAGYLHRCQNILFGMDTMSNILLIYLMIGNSGAALSLDRVWARFRVAKYSLATYGRLTETAREFLDRPPPSVSAGLALRLLQVHFCFIYMASGLSKLQGAAWWDHGAFWLTVANPEFTMVQYKWYESCLAALAGFRPAYAVAAAMTTFFTIGVEIGLPFLVWTRLRPYVIVLGLLLHSGIAIFMGLTLFSLLMMTMLLGYIPGAAFRERLFSIATVKKKIPFNPKQPGSVTAAARAIAWDTKAAVEPVAAG
ncbi:MAG TPA: hypothetical protein VGJ05_15105 [Fimbriiglobus sp.]